MRNGNMQKAKTYIQKAENLMDAEFLSGGSGRMMQTKESRRDAVHACLLLGAFHSEIRDHSSALWDYGQAEKLLKALTAETNAVCDLYSLSECYHNMGNAYMQDGSTDLARRSYEEAIEIAQPIVEETGLLAAQNILAGGYYHLGVLHDQANNLKEALDYYSKAFHTAQDLVERTDSVESSQILAGARNALGTLCSRAGQFANAVTCYSEAICMQEKLVQKSGQIHHKRSLGTMYLNLGAAYESMNQIDEATSAYQKSIDTRAALVQEMRSDAACAELSYSCSAAGNLCKTIGNIQSAVDCYRYAVQLLEASGGNDLPQLTVDALLLDACMAYADVTQSRAQYEKANRLADRLILAFPDDNSYREKKNHILEQLSRL